jgi:DNA-binding NtrC family response regulator
VRIPPLRQRPQDIIPLALHFLSLGRRPGQRAALSPELERELLSRSWPGNVRQLRNDMERVRLLNSDKLDYDLPDLGAGSEAGTPGERRAGVPVRSEERARDSAPRPDAAGGEEPAASGESPRETEVVGSGRSPMRIRQRVCQLFERQRQLTTREVRRILGVSGTTATRYLKALRNEGFIEKVMPNTSPRTHYYRIRDPES